MIGLSNACSLATWYCLAGKRQLARRAIEHAIRAVPREAILMKGGSTWLAYPVTP